MLLSLMMIIGYVLVHTVVQCPNAGIHLRIVFMRRVLACSLKLRRADGKFIHSFIGLFCVCIDDGVRV